MDYKPVGLTQLRLIVSEKYTSAAWPEGRRLCGHFT
jgi:hypothetical protein